MQIDISDIMQILVRSRRPRTGKEIAAALGASSRQKQEVYSLLHELVRRGELRRLRGGKFQLARQRQPVTGRITLLRNGSGLVTTDNGREIRIPERALFGARTGDRVEVQVVPGRRQQRPEGRILTVLERQQAELVGLFQQGEKEAFVVPLDGTGPAILVVGELPSQLTADQVVVINLEAGARPGRTEQGRIIEVLGSADDPEVAMRVIARRFGIPTAFAPETLEQATQISQVVQPEEVGARRDLRHLPFVTIDGETAKDFDDAVTLTEDGSGRFRLCVAIADVAHYVQQNSPLDREALRRGTSVYLPGTCLPMLPEALSNGICSLNPKVERLVLVAEIVFDHNAAALEVGFSEAVICSHARLTYTEVQRLLDTAQAARSELPHLRQLLPMKDLAGRLTRMRLHRGALDLDIPEAEIVLDAAGEPMSVVRARRTEAHRLIEEFMLAANEAVAQALAEAHFPLLFRVHEPPAEQDLEPFFNLAQRLGMAPVGSRLTVLERLQQVLARCDDSPSQPVLNRLLLRSLKQAFYHPENRGHFGLAAEQYCHFTSPIRRYPDLVVHRMLKQMLAGADGEGLTLKLGKRMLAVAEQSSRAERRAVDAERDASAMKTCQYMVQHVGETFAGRVVSVHAFGFFVELDTIFVEGLVHVASLGDAYYRFDEELGRLVGEGVGTIYEVGTELEVVVRDVNVQRREIDFVIAPEAGADASASGGQSRKRKSHAGYKRSRRGRR